MAAVGAQMPDTRAHVEGMCGVGQRPIDAWVHAAAVLDYVVESPPRETGEPARHAHVAVGRSPKHIMELKAACEGTVRIGFKLESGIKQTDLIHRAFAQIQKAGMTAVVANRLEDLGDAEKPAATS
ncbi:MAG: hypothetical protein CM15mP78_09230 [Candidatus Poseidoniales archaeon]|nr:MAG: hypothetical protein CM15mP78_09230 [Candidatus Poseidoniales archaeon]